MVSQLLLIGYLLNWLFAQNRPDVAAGILCFMIVVSSLIARRHHSQKSMANYLRILLAIFAGGTFNLTLVVLFVIRPEPIYSLSVVIPLAGMVYSIGMNTVSLAGERFWKQIQSGSSYVEARNESFRMSLIPQMNMFMAVGLVSLPGMMTGQVLSGVSPLIAVRYQIMVMCMTLGTAGMSVALYLLQCRKEVEKGSTDTKSE